MQSRKCEIVFAFAPGLPGRGRTGCLISPRRKGKKKEENKERTPVVENMCREYVQYIMVLGCSGTSVSTLLFFL